MSMRKLIIVFAAIASLAACGTNTMAMSPLPTPVVPEFTAKAYVPVVVKGPRWPVVEWDQKAGGGCSCDELEKLGARWGRQWGPWWQVCPNGAVIVPELWGPGQWNEASISRIAGSGWLLGANEPDFTGTIAAHVQAHAEVYEVACQPPCRLGSPAASHVGGVTWLRNWYTAFTDTYGRPPRLDFLDMHCYITPQHDAQACIDKLHAYEQFGDEIGVRDIVISETGWPTLYYWSQELAWASAQPWLATIGDDDRVLWAALFTCHVDQDQPWAGADLIRGTAGHTWNGMFTPGGLITYDGIRWAAWGEP